MVCTGMHWYTDSQCLRVASLLLVLAQFGRVSQVVRVATAQLLEVAWVQRGLASQATSDLHVHIVFAVVSVN